MWILKAFLSLLIVCCIQSLGISGVNAWKGEITLPTYPWEEDINPHFFALGKSIIYPYTMQDMISMQKENRTYQALFLENEYLKVTCLPELSGRIFSVLDKTTGEEMFHKNPVVKPGMIAMRGAWISGGIEWNTGPHGHSVTIVSPVNAALRKNTDGSATLVISNTEKIFRTRWKVDLTLHPGKAYLDEIIRIENPTDAVHPYYFWNCTAFVCLPGTRFIYPMTLGTDHDGTSFFSWPIHEGKDLTWLKNYDRPTSVFAYNCQFDFFGAYDVDLDRGIVQYANNRELIGKKAWTWGQSQDGIVSQRNLHEGDEQYIEVQSGPLLTQADYGLLQPRQAVQWQEWWYPVHGLGDGYEYANLHIAAQRVIQDGKTEFRLISTDTFKNSQIHIRHNNRDIIEKTIHLSPASPIIVPTLLEPGDSVEITITDRKNNLLLHYQSPLPIPEQSAPEPDWQSTKLESELTVEEIYLKALIYDKQTDRPEAREWYQKALSLDPGHVASLKGLAVLDLEAGLFSDAIQHLQTALDRNPDDGMAWFLLATAYDRSNQTEQALSCAYKAIRLRSHAALGSDLAGRIYMRGGQYSDALAAFERSLAFNADDERTRDHLLLAHYALGDKRTAQDLSRQRASHDPTSPLPQAVLTLFNERGMQNSLKKMVGPLGEEDFEITETCLIFAELGLYEEAYKILKSYLSLEGVSKNDPMLYYHLSAWAHRLGMSQESKEYSLTAEEMEGTGYFPARIEDIQALEHAIHLAESNGQHSARTHLRLGNLYGGLGRLTEAKEHWSKAIEMEPALNVGWRNLGLLAWKKEEDPERAIHFYRQAIRSAPDDQTLYRDLASILIEDRQRPQAILLLANTPDFETKRTDIIEILAQAYVDEGEYRKTLELLDRSFFSNWENRTVSRNVFARAHLELGKNLFTAGRYEEALHHFSEALTYPLHLGVGRPVNPAEAEFLYWKGLALSELGQTNEANEAWRSGARSRPEEYRTKCREKLNPIPY